MDDAVTPFPNEEQTPPDTKMSFFMGFHYPDIREVASRNRAHSALRKK
jgi:hypothetical protein